MLNALTILAGDRGELSPELALSEIRRLLLRRPELIEDLCPGFILVRRPVSPEERSRRMNTAAILQRQAEADKRQEAIEPILRQALNDDPGISLRALAKILDQSGIAPARSNTWSAPSVLAALRKAGLSNEPEEG